MYSIPMWLEVMDFTRGWYARGFWREHGSGWGRGRVWCSCAFWGSEGTSSSAVRGLQKGRSPRTGQQPLSARSGAPWQWSMRGGPACGDARLPPRDERRSPNQIPFLFCSSSLRSLWVDLVSKQMEDKEEEIGDFGWACLDMIRVLWGLGFYI